MKLPILFLLVLTLSGCCSCKNYKDKIAILEMVRDSERFIHSEQIMRLERENTELVNRLFNIEPKKDKLNEFSGGSNDYRRKN